MYNIEIVLLSAFFLLLGLAVGSFINVIVLRHVKGEWITVRSHCAHCNAQLTFFTLIPVFSYVIQKGRSLCCKKKLSIQYPLVEVGTGALFVLVLFSNYPFTTPFLYVVLTFEVLIWSLFMIITVYDIRTKLIPNIFSYTLAGIAFLSLFVGIDGFIIPSLWNLLGGPLLFLPFYLLWKVSHGAWLGLGDGKLALGIGWFLGLSQGGTAILLAFWLGAGISLLIIGVQRLRNSKKQLTLKSEVPFGPFLVLGTLLVYLFEIHLFDYPIL
jgi:prepilin signal peptidase PulO-like enzyme (type II secretory pathway)